MSGTECVRMVAQKLLAGSSSLGALEALLLPRGPTSHFSRLAAPTTTQRALDRAPCQARRGAWSVRGETNREARRTRTISDHAMDWLWWMWRRQRGYSLCAREGFGVVAYSCSYRSNTDRQKKVDLFS